MIWSPPWADAGTEPYGRPDVAIVRWPAEQARRAALRAEGQLRLLMVEPAARPPFCDDPLEDWIRLPATDGDIEARVEQLGRRATATRAPGDPSGPVLDADGILRHRGRWVALPETSARLAAELIAADSRVLSREYLLERVWGGQAVAGNTVEVAVSRLRRQLVPVGLGVRTVRRRGYVLVVEGFPPEGSV